MKLVFSNVNFKNLILYCVLKYVEMCQKSGENVFLVRWTDLDKLYVSFGEYLFLLTVG